MGDADEREFLDALSGETDYESVGAVFHRLARHRWIALFEHEIGGFEAAITDSNIDAPTAQAMAHGAGQYMRWLRDRSKPVPPDLDSDSSRQKETAAEAARRLGIPEWTQEEYEARRGRTTVLFRSATGSRWSRVLRAINARRRR